MNLRFSEDETIESDNGMSFDGLKLAGGSSNNISENLNDNPWDFNATEKIMESPTISQAIVHETISESKNDENTKILTISMYICYAVFALQIASMIWIVTQPSIDLYYNLQKLQGLFSLVELIVLIDVIIVQICYKKKISFFFLWLFALTFYPWRRGKYVREGETIGILCTVFSTIAIIVLLGNTVVAFKQYGTALVEDDVTRQEVRLLMDQVDENGNRYGDMISRNVIIGGVVYKKVNGVDAIGIVAWGKVSCENDLFINNMKYSVDTSLGFVKGENGLYKLEIVELGGKELSEYGSGLYWDTAIEP